jgi:hypothetical protein
MKLTIIPRAPHVRLLSIFLAVATIVGMLQLGRQEVTRRSAVVSVASSFASRAIEKENETERMPIRFDDGLRAPTVGGY